MGKRLIIAIAALSAFYIGLAVVYERNTAPFISGADANIESEVEAVKYTVNVYNSLLTDLFVSDGVPTKLNEFPASKQLKHEVFRNIGSLRGMNRVLVLDKASVNILDVKIVSPVRAEAVVFEEWNYVYQDAKSRKLVSDIKGLGHGFRYILNKDGGKWIVVDYYPEDVDMDAYGKGDGAH